MSQQLKDKFINKWILLFSLSTYSVAPTGATLCSSLQGAFDLLSTAQHIDKVEKIFVIGGAAVYKVSFAITYWSGIGS